ncbi:MAG: MATE family efflux transporter [Treponemataceae bacterium]|nr:MAG: MATE family efflux transporter [Treponemataceae bacterium]
MSSTKLNAADRLGADGIGKLLLQFSIPAVTGMLVQALYNVVDRIFVGNGVNEAALGGISLIMPVMTVTFAFAMLFGVGSANVISMRLGEKRKEDAQNTLNCCFWLLAGIGLVITALGLPLLHTLVSHLGAQPGSEVITYAENYYRIILMGQVFSMLGFGFSHCTRAQGFPKITMFSMLIGAGINTALDPLFIFVFHWGVEGAAIATVISQAASTVWILSFSFGKKAVIRLNPLKAKLDFTTVRTIISFGSAQFLLQFVMSAVQLLLNNRMSYYGSIEFSDLSHGGDIALTGMNIVGTVTMLVMMPVFGISQGAQPILGYNYGAKQFARVKKTYLAAIGVATIICIVGFAVTMLFPDAIVSVFSKERSEGLMRFTPPALRIVVAFLPLVGFQVISSNLFVVTGRPKTSILLSLMRQFIVLIPCVLIFGHFRGLWGVVTALPVADVAATIFTAFFIANELKKLKG